MKVMERNAQKAHRCACGCGQTINVGDKMFEVTYVLKGGHWYKDYYIYNHW